MFQEGFCWGLCVLRRVQGRFWVGSEWVLGRFRAGSEWLLGDFRLGSGWVPGVFGVGFIWVPGGFCLEIFLCVWFAIFCPFYYNPFDACYF